MGEWQPATPAIPRRRLYELRSGKARQTPQAGKPGGAGQRRSFCENGRKPLRGKELGSISSPCGGLRRPRMAFLAPGGCTKRHKTAHSEHETAQDRHLTAPNGHGRDIGRPPARRRGLPEARRRGSASATRLRTHPNGHSAGRDSARAPRGNRYVMQCCLLKGQAGRMAEGLRRASPPHDLGG